MIQSHLSYCICTWCSGNKTALLSSQSTANKFIRMIYNINYRAPVNDVTKSNEHLTIDRLANLEIVSFMHKYDNDNLVNLPSAFCNFYYQNCTNIAKNTTSLRQTRSHSNNFPRYSRINITKQSIKYKGPFIWNRVPSDIKELKNYKKFRNNLKTSLLK